MRKTLATLAILSAAICSADVVSTNTRAATEKWVSLRFASTQDLARALATQRVERVHDSAQPSRYLLGLSNGTGTVFEVTGPFTNLMVTLSDDFEETATHTRPAWTNNVFPFIESKWVGGFVENAEGNADLYYIESSAGTTVIWADTTDTLPAALTLLSGYGAGTATVSVASIYYATNVFAHFTTEAELEAAKAACGVVLTNTVNEAVSNLTADISASTNALMPYSRTVYGDVTTTNETGYAAFNVANAAVSSYASIIPSSYVGTVTNTFRYYLNNIRKTGVLTNKAWFVKAGFGAGYKAVSTVVSVKDAAGNVLASSASKAVNIDQTVTTQASITNTLAIPLNVYSGTVEVACIAVSTNASFSVRLYTGGQYASSLSFGEAPIPYATVSDVSGLRLGGATNITDGVTAGTYDDTTRTLNISNLLAGVSMELPEGIVTNGQYNVTLGEIAISGSTISRRDEADYWVPIAMPSLSLLNGQGGLFAGSIEINNYITDQSWKNTKIEWDYRYGLIFYTSPNPGSSIERMRIDLYGNVGVTNNLTVTGTNTAAVVSSQGPVMLGPTIGGKQAHIFTDGTNCFFVNVNSVTNALTTN